MREYSKSEEWLQRAEKTIPLGSQTFSKSRTQYPIGISPLYAERAKGCNIWDLDGNRYVDLVSALGCITLGYNHKGVNKAITKQIKSGISMSLPGLLEAKVAEQIVDMIPSAEMVRFGKNGSDATSAAIRLARAYTGRNHVLVSGYHGWQDWFIGSTTRNKGVPSVVSELTHSFQYNNLDSFINLLAEFDGQIAAVILEPMNARFPENNFLEEIRRITKEKGIVLIFDETLTGFRFANGGAQQFFGVIPDLSTFGKGMANGMPISAVVGSREIMLEMEEIFFSGTFGGELLSLAAADAVLQIYRENDVTASLAERGSQIEKKLNVIIQKYNFDNVLSFTGHPSWKFLNWNSAQGASVEQIKTLFMQEIFRSGVLVLSTHNVSLAMDDRAIHVIVNGYERAISAISTTLRKGDIESVLSVQPLEALFKVR